MRTVRARRIRQRRHERIVVEGCDGDLAADERFDVGQRDGIGLATEADGVAGRAGACRAPDPVHVVFGVLGQIVIEYVAHAGYVQAA
jgi:hypothetical protein